MELTIQEQISFFLNWPVIKCGVFFLSANGVQLSGMFVCCRKARGPLWSSCWILRVWHPWLGFDRRRELWFPQRNLWTPNAAANYWLLDVPEPTRLQSLSASQDHVTTNVTTWDTCNLLRNYFGCFCCLFVCFTFLLSIAVRVHFSILCSASVLAIIFIRPHLCTGLLLLLILLFLKKQDVLPRGRSPICRCFVTLSFIQAGDYMQFPPCCVSNHSVLVDQGWWLQNYKSGLQCLFTFRMRIFNNVWVFYPLLELYIRYSSVPWGSSEVITLHVDGPKQLLATLSLLLLQINTIHRQPWGVFFFFVFLSFILSLIFMLKNDIVTEQCLSICEYVQPQSQLLPGGFQNKDRQVISKYYFKEYRPQCPEKLYPWDFVCQESQSTGQPKKGNEKKDCHVASLWPTLWLSKNRRDAAPNSHAKIWSSSLRFCSSYPSSPSKRKKTLHVFEFFTRHFPCVISSHKGSEHVHPENWSLLLDSDGPLLPSMLSKGHGVRAASNLVLTKGF